MIADLETNTSPFLSLALVDGELSPSTSQLQLNALRDKFSIEKTPDGICIHIFPHCVIENPLHFIHTQSSNHMSIQHREIILGENSEVEIIDEFRDAGTSAAELKTHITAHRHSRLKYYHLQSRDQSSLQRSDVKVKQAQDSQVSAYLFSNGKSNMQQTFSVSLSGKGAACSLNGLYWLHEDNQQQEYLLHVDHLASHTESKMLYKGILDKKSRAVFRGKVHVHPEAQKIQAQQANHTILLSDAAEAVSQPELEIDADDVKCAHGATVGQLDHDALFYLRSRGVDEKTANNILLQAFLGDVFEQVQNKTIQHYIREQCHYDAV